MEEAREYFSTLEIPIAPQNSSIVYQRSQSENYEESRELNNDHQNNINKDFYFTPQERFNQRSHDLDNFAQRNRKNFQGSHYSRFHLSEKITWIRKIKGQDSFHLVRRIRLEVYKGVTTGIKLMHTLIRKTLIPCNLN